MPTSSFIIDDCSCDVVTSMGPFQGPANCSKIGIDTKNNSLYVTNEYGQWEIFGYGNGDCDCPPPEKYTQSASNSDTGASVSMDSNYNIDIASLLPYIPPSTELANFYNVINVAAFPPTTPLEGDSYRISSSPLPGYPWNPNPPSPATNHANEIATYTSGAWTYQIPTPGEYAEQSADELTYRFGSDQQWRLTTGIPVMHGGQAISTGPRIGSTTSTPLTFITNKTNRLIIKNTGEIVLSRYGTNTPIASGTNKYVLGVNTSGQIIELPLSTTIPSWQQTLDVSPTLTKDNTITIDDGYYLFMEANSQYPFRFRNNRTEFDSTTMVVMATSGSAISTLCSSEDPGNSEAACFTGSSLVGHVLTGIASDNIAVKLENSSMKPVIYLFQRAGAGVTNPAISMVKKTQGGGPITDEGISIDFTLADANDENPPISNSIISKVIATGRTELSFNSVDAGSEYTILALSGTGQARLPRYGQNLFTGTPAGGSTPRYLSVTSSGVIIEATLPATAAPDSLQTVTDISPITNRQITVQGYNIGSGPNQDIPGTGSNLILGRFNLVGITSGTYNIAIGENSLNAITSGKENVGVGPSSLRSNVTTNYNVAVGSNAMRYHGPVGNTGNENTALGYAAMINHTSGGLNTAVGGRVMYNNTNGLRNTAIGYTAMQNSTTGSDNIAVGYSALDKCNGTFNTTVGLFSMFSNTIGIENSVLGNRALYNSLGSYNVGIGTNAGTTYSNGDYSIFIGANTAPIPSVTSNQLNIANLIYSRDQVSLGIGTNNPLAKLHVAGTGKFDDHLTIGAYTLPTNAGAATHVLTSGGDGTVSWQPPGTNPGTGSYIFSSGLDPLADGINVKLGGTLTRDTEIKGGSSFTTKFSSTRNSNYTLIIENTGTTSASALQATSRVGIPATLTLNSIGSSSTISTILSLTNTPAVASTGIGSSIEFQAKAIDTLTYITNEIVSKWTDASTKTSEFYITGVNSTTKTPIFTLSGSGQLTLNNYTTGNTFTGTPISSLAVDSTGKVIIDSTVASTKFAVNDVTATATRAFDMATFDFKFHVSTAASNIGYILKAPNNLANKSITFDQSNRRIHFLGSIASPNDNDTLGGGIARNPQRVDASGNPITSSYAYGTTSIYSFGDAGAAGRLSFSVPHTTNTLQLVERAHIDYNSLTMYSDGGSAESAYISILRPVAAGVNKGIILNQHGDVSGTYAGAGPRIELMHGGDYLESTVGAGGKGGGMQRWGFNNGELRIYSNTSPSGPAASITFYTGGFKRATMEGTNSAFKIWPPSATIGTVAITSGSADIVGTSTNFTTNYAVGQSITIPVQAGIASIITATIGSITNNGLMTATVPFAVTASALTHNNLNGAVLGLYDFLANGNINVGGQRFIYTTEQNTSIGTLALNSVAGRALSLTAVGYEALKSNTIGVANVAIGGSALKENTIGGGNVAIGVSALQNNIGGTVTQGVYNVAIGLNALQNNTTGGHNIAVGTSAIHDNITGSGITAIGSNALSKTTVGNCTAVGSTAGINNTTGIITAIGMNSLGSNTTGTENTGCGMQTLNHNLVGSYNMAFGRTALYYNRDGNYNVAMGYGVMNSNFYGNNNIGIGHSALSTIGSRLNSFTIVNGGTNYTASTIITISAPVPPASPTGNYALGTVQATATAVINAGVITSLSIINRGSGYLPPPAAPPTFTITDAGGGTGAVITGTIGSAKNNTAIGYKAGWRNEFASGCIYIGNDVGGDGGSDNKLYIDNVDNGANSFMYGDMTPGAKSLNIDGGFSVTNRTLATSGVQQNSPTIKLKGQGWHTSDGSSRLAEVELKTIVTSGPTATTMLDINSTVNATQFKVSAMNTAPATPATAGTLGEIRVTATHIYVHNGTSWARAALTSW